MRNENIVLEPSCFRIFIPPSHTARFFLQAVLGQRRAPRGDLVLRDLLLAHLLHRVRRLHHRGGLAQAEGRTQGAEGGAGGRALLV